MKKIKIVNLDNTTRTRIYLDDVDISGFVSEVEIVKQAGRTPLVKLYLVGLVEFESDKETQVLFDTSQQNV